MTGLHFCSNLHTFVLPSAISNRSIFRALLPAQGNLLLVNRTTVSTIPYRENPRLPVLSAAINLKGGNLRTSCRSDIGDAFPTWESTSWKALGVTNVVSTPIVPAELGVFRDTGVEARRISFRGPKGIYYPVLKAAETLMTLPITTAG